MKNIIILAENEEQMQGIIRGVEALDSNREIGIIHGAYSADGVEINSEVLAIMAELAEATILHTANIPDFTHPRNIPIRNVMIDVPNDLSRNDLIEYMKDHNKDLINILLSQD